MNTTAGTATDRQISFIKDLLHSRQCTDAQAERCRARLADGSFSKKLASDTITWFLKQPKLAAKPVQTQLEMDLDDAMMNAMVQEAEKAQDVTAYMTNDEPVTEIGIYEVGDAIFKVTRSKKTGGLYASRLIYTVGQAERLTAAGTVIKAKYEYEFGAIADLRASHRVTAERAKALSIIFTSCIVCGRHLKNALSVERAIGPVCWKRV